MPGTAVTIVLVLLGVMLYSAAGLVAGITAMAGVATAPVVVPYVVVRLVTAVLERQPLPHQPTPSISEPALTPEPSQDDD